MNVNVAPEVAVPTAQVFKVYFRNDNGKLGRIDANEPSHKDAILEVKGLLVDEGDCLINKPVLVLIEGGKQ